MTRRDLYRLGSILGGGLITAALAVPGVAYIVDPLRKKRGAARTYPLAKLSELEVGVPRSFPIVDERQDAWVKYPKEPIGLVWLVRQPEGSKAPVVAFQAECPHLGCAVNLDEWRQDRVPLPVPRQRLHVFRQAREQHPAASDGLGSTLEPFDWVNSMIGGPHQVRAVPGPE